MKFWLYLESCLLIVLIALIAGSNVVELRQFFAEKATVRHLAQLAETMKSADLSRQPYHRFFQRASAGQKLAAPYDSFVVDPELDVFAFRRRFGYSGYAFDLLLYGGSHEGSNYQHLYYDYTINGSQYHYKLRQPKANHG